MEHKLQSELKNISYIEKPYMQQQQQQQHKHNTEKKEKKKQNRV